MRFALRSIIILSVLAGTDSSAQIRADATVTCAKKLIQVE